jgi:hypothetical protein
VIEMDIIFNGSKIEKVRISPVSREQKSTPFLVNRRLMKELGVIVNPEKLFVVTDKLDGYVPRNTKNEIHGGIEFGSSEE